jgi:hypothetical protein
MRRTKSSCAAESLRSLPLVLHILGESFELPPHIEERLEEHVATFGIEIDSRNWALDHIVIGKALDQNVALSHPVSETALQAGDPPPIEIQLWNRGESLQSRGNLLLIPQLREPLCHLFCVHVRLLFNLSQNYQKRLTKATAVEASTRRLKSRLKTLVE